MSTLNGVLTAVYLFLAFLKGYDLGIFLAIICITVFREKAFIPLTYLSPWHTSTRLPIRETFVHRSQ
jgi:hypothetical protein